VGKVKGKEGRKVAKGVKLLARDCTIVDEKISDSRLVGQL